MSAVLHPSDATTQGGVASPQLRLVSLLCPNVRRGGGGRRDRYTFAHEATTMLAFGLLLNFAGVGLFCWLIFTLAVYALPFFVAINAGMLALHSGAGVLGALIVAVAARRQVPCDRSNRVRRDPVSDLACVIAAVFALPAAFAGYPVALAMSQIGVPSLVWREVFACVGAVFIGGTAWTRLAVFTEPRPVEPGRAAGDSPYPALAAATREG